MPKYVYHCNECDGDFEIVHGMTERQEQCILCESSVDIYRIPQMPHIKTSQSNQSKDNQKIGSHVKEAIKDNTKILKQQKKEAISWEYNPND